MFGETFVSKGGGGGGDVALIADAVLAVVAASITFTGIPATFKHLQILGIARTTRAFPLDGIQARFNGDAGANYDSLVAFFSNPATTGTTQTIAATSLLFTASTGDTAPAGVFAHFSVFLPSYADAVSHKGYVSPSSNPGNVAAANLYIYYWGGKWRSTAAINSITLFPSVGPNFQIGTHISLYGWN